MEERLDQLTAEDGSAISWYSEPNTASGEIDVVVNAPLAESGTQARSNLFEHVNLTVDPNLESSARTNDTAPFKAGTDIRYTD
ncbi:hypothetical protein C5E06_18510 [Pseudoclavibacter sp. RFBI5]|uniref:hypothetical protein n=1 Tax=Pseudoclavibacter sp. RFBI5 TaxID=2080578 RepID=UPI000CE8D0C3|nr:hypothetical protein [Pseudoclavibacter sp. RFBI5]PPG00686.1 hypothetical protein C5E06_18510 [Pseudoclavibacter sp. RFBI5]